MAAELTSVQEHGLLVRSWRSTRGVLGQAWATRAGRVGLTILVFFTLLALFAPWLAPEDPTRDFSQDILAPPSSEHWLGTDANGADVLSGFIIGSRVSIAVGFAAALISGVIGGVVGITAGYYGGTTDKSALNTIGSSHRSYGRPRSIRSTRTVGNGSPPAGRRTRSNKSAAAMIRAKM